jgi:hypothetical protein
MKRMILILAMLVPATLLAQEAGPSLVADQADTAGSVAGYGESVTLPAPNPDAGANSSASGPGLAASFSQVSKSPQAKPEKPSRPPIEGSMVGYIDNPIVESEIRIRFDAAFNDEFPDRAEFFYGKCGCYRPGDPNAPGPPPGSGTAVIPRSLNFQQLYILGEYAPIRRFSVFAEIPVRWIQAQGLRVGPPNSFPNEGGLSDVMAGFKLAAIASESTYLTFQFRGYFPSGDASKGLGTNHYSVEPELLLYHRFSSPLTLEGQVGDWHPIGGSAGVPQMGSTATSEGFAGDIFIYGIGASYKLYSRNRVAIAPVLELVGWDVLSGFETLPEGPVNEIAEEVSGTSIVNMKFGVRTNIGPHNSFYIGYGHALTHATWYQQIVRAEYRYSF